MEYREVVVIGAGPAGAVAAALLKRQGHDVLVLERQQFPRFSIGESLLAHCLEFIEEAGMMPAVRAAGFQTKNGAAFARGDEYTYFDFRDKFSPGPGSTFQVQRAQFDKVLADDAARQGVEVRYQQEVIAADFTGADGPLLTVRGPQGQPYQVRGRFVLDASGYGRVLARLLDLERPSSMPPRKAIFTHIEDRIDDAGFDRDKILISVHPEQSGIWYWLIPFSNGRSSFGVVGGQDLFGGADQDLMTTLRAMADAAPQPQAGTAQRRLGYAGQHHRRLFRQRHPVARAGLRAAGQRRRIPGPGVLFRRHHRAALVQAGCRRPAPAAGWRNGRLATRFRRPADAWRGNLPRLCAGLV